LGPGLVEDGKIPLQWENRLQEVYFGILASTGKNKRTILVGVLSTKREAHSSEKKRTMLVGTKTHFAEE
jgi:hypothetical protein